MSPGTTSERGFRWQTISWISFFGSALALVVLGVLLVDYLTSGVYLDHIESTVVIVGWQYLHGAPLYPLKAGLPAFATYYGPWAFLTPLPLLASAGATVFVSKLAPALALAASVALMTWRFVGRRKDGAGGAAMLLLAAGLLAMFPACLWVRPDPFETLLVVLGIVAASSRHGALVVGLCMGLAVNFKVHAFAYFLPVVFDLCGRGGWRALLQVVAVSLVTFFAPFLVPGISLRDYLTVLSAQVGGRSLTAEKLTINLVFAFLAALPLLLALASRRTEETRTADWRYAIAALLTLLLLLYPASFPGAGPYHFLPLLPVLADALHRLGRRTPLVACAPYGMLILGLSLWAKSPAERHPPASWSALADEARVLARPMGGDSVQVGYGEGGDSYLISQTSRAALTLAGHPAHFDAQVMMELMRIGIDASASQVQAIADCQVRLWLLPAGENPFSVRSYYCPGVLLFDEAFRRAFHDNYRLDKTLGKHDLWVCSHAAP